MQQNYCLFLCQVDGVVHYYRGKNVVDLLEESSGDAGQVVGEGRQESRSLTNILNLGALNRFRALLMGLDPHLDGHGNGVK